MKTRLAALLLIAVFGWAVISFAEEQRVPEIHTQTLRIKTHGEVVAELKVSTKAPIRIEGGGIMVGPNSMMTFVSPTKGGITVRINGPGELPITLKADEVELVPEQKLARPFASSMLLAE